MRTDRRAVHQVVAAERLELLIAQDGGLRRLERRHHALAQAILRHMRQAEVAHLRRVAGMAGIDQPATHRQPAAGRRADARQHLQQLGLAVARDAGDADDLAGPQFQPDIVEQPYAARVDQGQVLGLQQHFARLLRRLVELHQHLAADHQLGQLLGVGLRRAAVGHDLALAHDIDTVGGGHDLAQLVGDQHDRDAARLQRRQDAEQLVGLLRRQHGARLVEDQDARAAEQHLQDLDALLLADRKIGHQRIGVDRKPVLARQSRQLGAGRRQAASQQRSALGAQHQVLQHGEGADQHEMLVHHADAVGDGIARVFHADRGAVDADLAGIGVVEAVEDAHQRRLAGAVLADDAGDRALLDAQRHAAHGMDVAERFLDALELDRRSGFHHRLDVTCRNCCSCSRGRRSCPTRCRPWRRRPWPSFPA